MTVKHNPDGMVEWLAEHDSVYTLALAVDHIGRVYVTGSRIDGQAAVATVALDRNGQKRWVALHEDDFESAIGTVITVSTDSSIYVSGGGLARDPNVFNPYNFVTLKYDVNGNQQWVASYFGGSDDLPVSIALSHSAGVVFVGGGSNIEFMNFGSVVKNITLAYDLEGILLWTQELSGRSNWGFGTESIKISPETAAAPEAIYTAGTFLDDIVVSKLVSKLVVSRFQRGDTNGDAQHDVADDQKK